MGSVSRVRQHCEHEPACRIGQVSRWLSGCPSAAGLLKAETWTSQSVGRQCAKTRRTPASVDCHPGHALSKLFLYRFRACLESLFCCPPSLFPRAFLVVSLVPLVAAAATASPGATSSITPAPAPRDGVVCTVAASSHLVEQSSRS